VVERQKLVQDEDGNWQSVYVDCGPSHVYFEDRPTSRYGRKASARTTDDHAEVDHMPWAALAGYDDDPTADEAIARADRATARRALSDAA
jgi:hypothetical protein